MSTQSEREAAARAFAAGVPFADFDAIIDAPEGWYLPDGSDSGELGWVELDEVLDRWKAHARAQLAREAAKHHAATSVECNNCGAMLHAGAIGLHVCPTPARYAGGEAAPALTLKQTRKAAKAHGFRLVHESGWEQPDAIMTRMLAVLATEGADETRYCDMLELCDNEADEREWMRSEIARLRALGVTPAVLK